MPRNPNRAAATALIEEFARSGVTDACISPGSRSTALVLALSRCSMIRSWIATDERSGGFFALGIARESRRPVLLVSTSGTAAANYWPAVAEASTSGVPLIVLTADRPVELRDCGAAQTIDQAKLFGSHVRWAFDLPAPEVESRLEEFWRTIACRAAATAMTERGPVHLNLPMREPLLDVEEELADPPSPAPGRPKVRVHPGRRVPEPRTLSELAAELSGIERGLVVCGPGTGGAASAAAVAGLAASLDWPILADPLSGLRFGPHDRSRVVDAYDLCLRDGEFAARSAPEAILQFGRLPASKPLERFLAGAPARRRVVVAPDRSWPDPLHRASHLVRAEVADFCEGLASELGLGRRRGESGFSQAWLAASSAVRAAFDRLVAAEGSLLEGKVFPVLCPILAEGAVLYAGNSMPVRDADTFLSASPRRLEVQANRGASGIDGVLSTALGSAAAAGRPTALVIGDLGFLHDLGGLVLAARHRLSLLVVLIENDGGGIFSFLPQAALGETFERYFATPHGIDVRGAVEMAGGTFVRVGSWEEFAAACQSGLGSGGLAVVAVPSDRRRNAARHRELVAAALEEARSALRAKA